MKRRASVSVLAVATLAALAMGCDLLTMNWSSRATFTIDRDRAAAGQQIEVTFQTLDQNEGRRYWVAIQREDAPRTEQEGRVPVPEGARTMKLFARQPGSCEVRVYTESSGDPNQIIARRKLRVVE